MAEILPSQSKTPEMIHKEIWVDRLEPRRLKQRRKRYPLLNRPRDISRQRIVRKYSAS